MRTITLAVILLLLGLALVTRNNVETVAVRTWITDTISGAQLPEMADSELAVPWLKDRASFGVAFSGGGARSASASLGQLRALHGLGWLRRARYISSNSGGSWAAVPFTYLPLDIDDDRFLGEYISPEELDDHNLRPSTTDTMAFGTAIHNASTIDEILEIGRGDEAYSDIVASVFLEPFGLHDNEKFFTFHKGALKSVLAGNATLR